MDKLIPQLELERRIRRNQAELQRKLADDADRRLQELELMVQKFLAEDR